MDFKVIPNLSPSILLDLSHLGIRSEASSSVGKKWLWIEEHTTALFFCWIFIR